MANTLKNNEKRLQIAFVGMLMSKDYKKADEMLKKLIEQRVQDRFKKYD